MPDPYSLFDLRKDPKPTILHIEGQRYPLPADSISTLLLTNG